MDHLEDSGVRGLVRRRPLTSFFLLAFTLSWVGWLPYVLSTSGLGIIPLEIPAVLGTTQLVGVLPGAYIGPFTAALIVTAIAEGRPGLVAWKNRLLKWRVGWRWYAGVLTIVPAGVLASTLVLPGALSGAQVVSLVAVAAYVPLLVLQFFTTSVAEEPGWRDFALPRLQTRFGPVTGTVILGTFWGGWHLPLFLTEWGGVDITWVVPVEFVLACIPLSIAMTWVFNRTGQSLPLVMVLHAGINTTFTAIWPSIFPTLGRTEAGHVFLIGSTLAAAVVLIATRGRLGLRTAHAEVDAPRESPEPVSLR